jgi:hypothetical protein
MRTRCVNRLMAWLLLGASAAAAQNRPATVSGPAAGMSGIALGIFVKGGVKEEGVLIDELGRTPAIIQSFNGWNAFPKEFLDFVVGKGAMPMVTIGSPGSLVEVAGGQHDQVIGKWAQAAKAYPHVIYVRLMWEMNGGWYTWGFGNKGNTAPQYVAAFRHIVDVFHQSNVENVQFVWCVSASAQRKGPPLKDFFPGDEYVDWVSMDGYNHQGGRPISLQAVFMDAYEQLTKMSNRPVMIAETGTVEDSADPSAKAKWLTEGFLRTIPQKMPRVKAVLYFDAPGQGFTYPLHSSQASFEAFKQIVASPLYQASAPTQPLKY